MRMLSASAAVPARREGGLGAQGGAGGVANPWEGDDGSLTAAANTRGYACRKRGERAGGRRETCGSTRKWYQLSGERFFLRTLSPAT
jgi:hypothetical protein